MISPIILFVLAVCGAGAWLIARHSRGKFANRVMEGGPPAEQPIPTPQTRDPKREHSILDRIPALDSEGACLIPRMDMEQHDFNVIWERMPSPVEAPVNDNRPVANLYSLENEIGLCPAADEHREVCRSWRHPATVHDMALETGLSIESILSALEELLSGRMLDQVDDERYVANHEGMVHSRADMESALVLHVLLNSRGHSLYIDELQVRTDIREHRPLYEALQRLVEDGLVRSEGVRYTLARMPVSAACISRDDRSLPGRP